MTQLTNQELDEIEGKANYAAVCMQYPIEQRNKDYWDYVDKIPPTVAVRLTAEIRRLRKAVEFFRNNSYHTHAYELESCLACATEKDVDKILEVTK